MVARDAVEVTREEGGGGGGWLDDNLVGRFSFRGAAGGSSRMESGILSASTSNEVVVVSAKSLGGVTLLLDISTLKSFSLGGDVTLLPLCLLFVICCFAVVAKDDGLAAATTSENVMSS